MSRRSAGHHLDTREPVDALFMTVLDPAFSVPAFPPVLEPEPPHSEYWQSDEPPYAMLKQPDGWPGPEGYHLVRSDLGEKAFWRQEHGLPVAFIPSESNARPPGVAKDPTAPGGHVEYNPDPPLSPPASPWTGPGSPSWRDRATRDIKRGRTPRLPRKPRAPRTPRKPRPYRFGRIPRAPRPPRPPRPKRPPRPPRPKRPPGKKYQEYDYYCGTDDETGANRHFGAPIKVPRGTKPPATQPGTHLRRVSGSFTCDNDQCDGPLSYVSPWLAHKLDVLVNGRYAEEERLVRKIDQGRKLAELRWKNRLRPLSQPIAILGGFPITSSYCCVCGAVGTCWASGVDCRQLPVKQRSKGEC